MANRDEGSCLHRDNRKGEDKSTMAVLTFLPLDVRRSGSGSQAALQKLHMNGHQSGI